MQATLSAQIVGSPRVPLRPACGLKASSKRCLLTVQASKGGYEADAQKKVGWLAAAGVFGALVAAQLVLAPLQSAEAVSLPGSDVKKSDLGPITGTPGFDDIERNPAGKSRAYAGDKPEAKLRPYQLERGGEASTGSLKTENRPGFLNPLKQ